MSTHTYRIRGPRHDAGYKSSSPVAWSYTGTTLLVDANNTAYLQFACAIPIGATVSAATMTVYPTTTVVGTVTGGVATVVGSADYTADLTASFAGNLPITSATWSTSAWATTGLALDVTTLVAAFIARTDYMPGDLVTISMTDPDGSAGRAIYAFETGLTTAATLAVTFTEAAGLPYVADVLTALTQFGERVLYKPVVGTARTILAIVDRQDASELEGMDGVKVIPITLVVANDQTSGIASWEIVTGDRVKVSARHGGPALERLIVSVRVQDSGAVELGIA